MQTKDGDSHRPNSEAMPPPPTPPQDRDEEEDGDLKCPVSVSNSSPPPSSSHDPLKHDHAADDTDSPPHPIDSPSSSGSSLSSGHSSISRLSSPGRLAIIPVEVGAEAEAELPSSPLREVSVKRSVRGGPPPAQPVLEKVDQVVLDGGADEDGRRPRPRPRPNLSILKRARRESMLRRLQLLARIFGSLFCLVAFSVMAADKDQGWAVDSFYQYKQFRFCLAVNAIGFLYSALQACDLAYFSATGKHLANFNLRPLLDFSFDQALSYLLISATSSAATRVDDWQRNWGKDKFPQMATASVAFTALAFILFALSSVVSIYTLSTHTSF